MLMDVAVWFNKADVGRAAGREVVAPHQQLPHQMEKESIPD